LMMTPFFIVFKGFRLGEMLWFKCEWCQQKGWCQGGVRGKLPD